MKSKKDLEKIQYAIDHARQILSAFTPGKIESTLKDGGDPVTEADLLLDEALKQILLEPSEGWLSEETADDPKRLGCRRVWIVDPLDGTREFIEGIPEWCVSIALVEDGTPAAAGICNPAADQTFLGSLDAGITLNGKPVRVTDRKELKGAAVLASRSEIKRGEWVRFENAPFETIPMGSVAYKLAQVAAGLADATFTLTPKNEWDVAAGWLLVQAAGGRVLDKNGNPREFNRENPLLPGMFADNFFVLSEIIDWQRSL